MVILRSRPSLRSALVLHLSIFCIYVPGITAAKTCVLPCTSAITGSEELLIISYIFVYSANMKFYHLCELASSLLKLKHGSTEV